MREQLFEASDAHEIAVVLALVRRLDGARIGEKHDLGFDPRPAHRFENHPVEKAIMHSVDKRREFAAREPKHRRSFVRPRDRRQRHQEQE